MARMGSKCHRFHQTGLNGRAIRSWKRSGPSAPYALWMMGTLHHAMKWHMKRAEGGAELSGADVGSPAAGEARDAANTYAREHGCHGAARGAVRACKERKGRAVGFRDAGLRGATMKPGASMRTRCALGRQWAVPLGMNKSACWNAVLRSRDECRLPSALPEITLSTESSSFRLGGSWSAERAAKSETSSGMQS
eukprot:scaffold14391_cov116-Isochrysis_galbana.AAC.5